MAREIDLEAMPRIVRAYREATVHIAARYALDILEDDTEYLLTYYPVEEYAVASGWSPHASPHRVRAQDGQLCIRLLFEAEQEHVILVEVEKGGERRRIGTVRLYSLEGDLYSLRPYKGDLHVHSVRSDGREAPAFVAAASRQIGLDFVAVTDHHLYAPSLEAIDQFSGLSIDLAIFPGEEVHAPGNPVHIINFGGAWSVNALFATEAYQRGTEALLADLGTLSRGVDPYQVASCRWCFEEIRRAGGLGIFCHPYWFTQNRYAPSGALTAYLFETRPFDAFEVIGGYYRHEVDSNKLQVARYHEEQLRGGPMAIVGVSDAHGCLIGELFGWYYTMVFATGLSRDELIGAIKALRSVAIEAMPGESLRAYGPLRLIKYALFLAREVMPTHDALCAVEGQLMFDHLKGDPVAAAALGLRRGRVGRYYRRIWGDGD